MFLTRREPGVPLSLFRPYPIPFSPPFSSIFVPYPSFSSMSFSLIYICCCEDFRFLLMAVHASVHGHLHKDDTHKSTQTCFHPFSHDCMEIYAIYLKALWSKQKGVPAALLSHGSGAAGLTPGIDVSAPAGLSAIERWRSWTSL